MASLVVPEDGLLAIPAIQEVIRRAGVLDAQLALPWGRLLLGLRLS